MPIKQAESRLNFGTVVVAFLFFWLDNPCESSRPMLVIIKITCQDVQGELNASATAVQGFLSMMRSSSEQTLLT